jgi:zinc D-Ala-D-Ala carboxypeptidase
MGRKSFVAVGFVVMSLFASGLYTVSGWLTANAAQPGQQAVVAAEERTAAPAPKKVTAVVSEAAVRNRSLARDIQWPFGGRTQKGWYLHAALIANIVDTDSEPDSTEFAEAVASWQKSRGLSPADGVVTLDVWKRMMGDLQAARRKDATAPPQDELVLVSSENWWDSSRSAELRMVRRDAYEAYERMVAAARADLGKDAGGNYFKLVSGYRSAEYQAKLRAAAGNPSTASLAIHSPHSTGRALDIYVGGDPVSTADANRAIQVSTPAFKWLARNAHKYGFRPYFYEPWHWEYDPRLAKN